MKAILLIDTMEPLDDVVAYANVYRQKEGYREQLARLEKIKVRPLHDQVYFKKHGNDLVYEGTVELKYRIRARDEEELSGKLDDCIDRDYLEIEQIWIDSADEED